MANRRFGWHSGVVTARKVNIGVSGVHTPLQSSSEHIININSTSAFTSGTAVAIQAVHHLTATSAKGRAILGQLEVDDVILGGWSNAIKAYIDFNDSGQVAGLGSALCAEMRLPAKTLTGGNYACFEGELVVQASGATGSTPVSFMHLQASGDAAALTDYNATGYLFSLQGLADDTGNIFDLDAGPTVKGSLRILIGSTPYYIMLASSPTA